VGIGTLLDIPGMRMHNRPIKNPGILRVLCSSLSANDYALIVGLLEEIARAFFKLKSNRKWLLFYSYVNSLNQAQVRQLQV
jgi:hypothetical protein